MCQAIHAKIPELKVTFQLKKCKGFECKGFGVDMSLLFLKGFVVNGWTNPFEEY